MDKISYRMAKSCFNCSHRVYDVHFDMSICNQKDFLKDIPLKDRTYDKDIIRENLTVDWWVCNQWEGDE